MVDTGEANPTAASRTLLELIATLMESSFAALGEGVIMGTLPAYIERFGQGNAKYLHRNFVNCEPTGAGSSLTAMNFISKVTQTAFDQVEATEQKATKRLKTCEFLEAFDSRGDFPKTMICMLHRAAYQGSVNAFADDPKDGFDVAVKSRILFGDKHCDFEVTSRKDRSDKEDLPTPPETVPDADELEWLGFGFYTFILTSFVDYLTVQLPADQVQKMLRDAAQEVGSKVFDLMHQVGLLPDEPAAAAAAVLTMGGRKFDGDLRVVSCPQAQHIIDTTKPHNEEDAQKVRGNACRLCRNLVQGAVTQVAPGCQVLRTGSIALGDEACEFSIGGK